MNPSLRSCSIFCAGSNQLSTAAVRGSVEVGSFLNEPLQTAARDLSVCIDLLKDAVQEPFGSLIVLLDLGQLGLDGVVIDLAARGGISDILAKRALCLHHLRREARDIGVEQTAGDAVQLLRPSASANPELSSRRAVVALSRNR
jgi:hypothetical protein